MGVGEDDEPTKYESYEESTKDESYDDPRLHVLRRHEGSTKGESYDDPWCMPNFHDKPTPIRTSASKHLKKLPSSRMARLTVYTPR